MPSRSGGEARSVVRPLAVPIRAGIVSLSLALSSALLSGLFKTSRRFFGVRPFVPSVRACRTPRKLCRSAYCPSAEGRRSGRSTKVKRLCPQASAQRQRRLSIPLSPARDIERADPPYCACPSSGVVSPVAGWADSVAAASPPKLITAEFFSSFTFLFRVSFMTFWLSSAFPVWRK